MRRFLIIFLLVFTVLLGAVLTVPWWLGGLLGKFGGSHGITFSRYERKGYARFVLHDVTYERPGVKVTTNTLEIDTPLLFAWRAWRKKQDAVVIGSWHVETSKKTAGVEAPENASPGGLVPLQRQLDKIAAQLNRWTPVARTGAGEIAWPNGKLTLAAAVWKDGTLQVTQLTYGDYMADVKVRASASGGDWPVELALPAQNLAVQAILKKGQVTGSAIWSGQAAQFEADFAATGWKPVNGELRLKDWKVAGDRVRAGRYFSEVTGNAEVLWHEGRLKIDAKGAGAPVKGEKGSALGIALNAEGNTETVTIHTLHLSFPGAEADLTQPVSIGRDGRLRSANSVFSFTADLARQPWFKAEGSIKGEVKVSSNSSQIVRADFTVAADNVVLAGEQVKKLRAAGFFEGNRLTLTSTEIDAGKGTHLVLNGGWNFTTGEIFAAHVKGQMAADAVRRWLPQNVDFAGVEISAEASGRLDNFSHRGHIQATRVKWAQIKPLALTADWQGEARTLSDFTVKLQSGASEVVARGAVLADGLDLKELTLQKAKQPQLSLVAPVRIAWRPQLAVQKFHLSGPAGNFEASIIWAPEGKIDVDVARFAPAWIDDWVAIRNDDWQISSLKMQGSWKKSPMTFTLESAGSFSLGADRSAQMAIKASGNGEGAKIETLRVSEGSGNIVNATGNFPVRLYPAQGPVFQWSDAEEFNLQAATEPNAEFWQRLTELTGLELLNPRVNLNLAGTRSTVKGTAKVQVDRIAMDEKKIRKALPTIENLDVELSGDTSRVKVDQFSLTVEKQIVRAQGDLAIAHGFWPELQADPLAYVQNHGTLHLEVPDAEISAFTRFLPNVLSPVGRIAVDLNLKEGGHLGGAIKLSQAASRPLGPLGILQDIGADVRFEDRTVKLQSVVAKSGGQPVTLTGTIELNAKPDVEPRYDVALKGNNIPFVRQMGLLLRGDLDLKLTSPASGPPQVTGKARLRDSLFLADVRSFIPSGGGQTTASRPPYFSVETAPLNAWVLNVDVSGQRFMRLQTPVFTGLVSAQFKLGGTLGSPRVVGDATIDQGRVLMPFVSFAVSQGSVRLTEASPYEPTLFVRGTARRFNYDLTFELTGTASRPVVVFTSSPALDSEQVLLMVMTGAAPSNETTSTTTQRAARIGAFLGQGLLDSVRGSSDGEDHLSIVSGEKISRQGRETYDIEYGLSERWALTGEYDEFDDYNVGVKWLMFRDLPWKKEEKADEK